MCSDDVSRRQRARADDVVIRKEACPFSRTISGVRLCWELEEPKGSKGFVGRKVGGGGRDGGGGGVFALSEELAGGRPRPLGLLWSSNPIISPLNQTT